MIFFPAILLGAAFGWWRAARRGGNRLDKLQYAAAHAILFAIVALLLTIILNRMS